MRTELAKKKRQKDKSQAEIRAGRGGAGGRKSWQKQQKKTHKIQQQNQKDWGEPGKSVGRQRWGAETGCGGDRHACGFVFARKTLKKNTHRATSH